MQLDANTAEITLFFDGVESNIMRGRPGIPRQKRLTAKRKGKMYVVQPARGLVAVLTRGLSFTLDGNQLNYAFQQSNGISSTGVATRK